MPLIAHSTDKAQVRCMDERGRLQGLARGLLSHLRRGQFAPLLIDERDQLLGSFGIAMLSAVEDLSDVAHASG